MKNRSIIFILLLATGSLQLSAQDPDTYQNSNGQGAQLPDGMNFVTDEVLVKFKDDVVVTQEMLGKLTVSNGLKSALTSTGLNKAEKLFPGAKQVMTKSVVRTPLGKEMEVPSLHNIYKFKLKNTTDQKGLSVNVLEVVEIMKQLPEVEYAEPNYIYSIGDPIPDSPEMTREKELDTNNNKGVKNIAGLVPNDPLYSQQWGIRAIEADEVWNTHTGDTTSVIAILDTGIDWLHPDLEENIWTNADEIPNNGKDDDGNGFIDDVKGWDFINNDQNPMDDNSHGTHCAGIAAATGNNGLGIAGVNWKAKLQSIKVFHSSGTGDAATIAQGINYAASNGATVINMSFGSYASSHTMETALQNAYLTSVLVASAGNDRKSINSATSFPACLSYVLGVQAEALFSNYDPDGPVYSIHENEYNYELKSPGAWIISTVPGGNYRSMTGTSMAAPFITGAISLYLSYFPDKSLEEMWSDFIYSTQGYTNANRAFFNTEKYPVLDLKDFQLVDSLPGSDIDGMADAGETVEISVTVRNSWAQADSVYVILTQSIFGDTSDVTILKDSVYFGSISTYATLDNKLDPFLVKINDDCFNNRVITLNAMMKNAPDIDSFSQSFDFRIYNGEEVEGLLEHDTTFTPDKFWLINNNLRVGTGVTLTILPGTHVQINAEIDNRGYIHAVGKPDSLIIIEGGISGNSLLKYVSFDLKGQEFYNGNTMEYCILKNGASPIRAHIMENCYISDFYNKGWSPSVGADSIRNCYFKNIVVGRFNGNIYQSVVDKLNSRVSGVIYSSHYSVYNEIDYHDWPFSLFVTSSNIGYHKNTFFTNYPDAYFVKTTGESDYVNLPNQYWGTTDDEKIKPKYFDFWNDASLPFLNYEPLLTAPSDSCPGHVWKVLVNGQDAQDEYVDPLGVGPQRFDVYFNRAMDTTYTPQLTFGVRWPYNQQTVTDSASWSADQKIWTAYKTIQLFTGDGINRIRVSGARDPESWKIPGWEIPVEDARFEFVISAATSSSLDFLATPGLGKVDLEWNNIGLEDLLGFNMYRMEHINDTTLTQPALVNTTLITDTVYTDFSVVPDLKYYYFYKVVRTDLSESDSSITVSAIPFTSAMGDANGDLAVNVSDIISIVSYILLKDPQPFIFEAADVNTDGVINVLDVTGVVNNILNPGKSVHRLSENGSATVFFRNDTVFISTNASVAGIQFTLHNITPDDYKVLPSLEPFERATVSDGDSLIFLAYSMTGKTIGPGVIPILKLQSGSTWLDNLVLSDLSGTTITSTVSNTTGPTFSIERMNTLFEYLHNYPNPLSELTYITFRLVRPVDKVVFTVMNSMGQKVHEMVIENPMVGTNQFTWRPQHGPGLYIGRMSVVLSGKCSSTQSIKMIVQ